jgi:hypothetical protein
MPTFEQCIEKMVNWQKKNSFMAQSKSSSCALCGILLIAKSIAMVAFILQLDWIADFIGSLRYLRINEVKERSLRLQCLCSTPTFCSSMDLGWTIRFSPKRLLTKIMAILFQNTAFRAQKIIICNIAFQENALFLPNAGEKCPIIMTPTLTPNK